MKFDLIIISLVKIPMAEQISETVFEPDDPFISSFILLALPGDEVSDFRKVLHLIGCAYASFYLLFYN